MKYILSLVLGVLGIYVGVSRCCNAAESPVTGEILIDPSIEGLFPREAADVERALRTGTAVEASRRAISLLREVRDLRSNEGDAGQAREAREAYRASWELCLAIHNKASDGAVRGAVLREWNAGLVDDAIVADQIAALKVRWNRALLTEELWRVLAVTNSNRTIAAFCYVLYEFGNASDAQRLAEKEASVFDKESQGRLRNAINYIRHRERADPDDPGPGTAPPTFE